MFHESDLIWFLKFLPNKEPTAGTKMWQMGIDKLTRWSGVPMVHRPTVFDHAALRTNWMAQHLADLWLVLGKDDFPPSIHKIDRLATHHDDSEMIDQDLPTPFKMAMSPEEKLAFQRREQESRMAIGHFRLMLDPNDQDLYMQDQAELKAQETIESQIVEVADKLDALGEILHEVRCGNRKFLEFLELRGQIIGRLDRFHFWKIVKSHPTLELDKIPTAGEISVLPNISIDSLASRENLIIDLLGDGVKEWPMFYQWWIFRQFEKLQIKDLERIILPGWRETLWQRWGIPPQAKTTPGGIALRHF